jgi:hypothetical protein
MSTCSSEAAPQRQLTSIEKHDEKKNMYIRGRRNNIKIIELKNWRN